MSKLREPSSEAISMFKKIVKEKEDRLKRIRIRLYWAFVIVAILGLDITAWIYMKETTHAFVWTLLSGVAVVGSLYELIRKR